MGHVEVAANDDGFVSVESAEIISEGGVPLQAIVESAQFVLRVGHVDIDQIKCLHFERHHASLAVVLVQADALSHA